MRIGNIHNRGAFTLLELLFASATFAAVTIGLLMFGSTALRMIAKNIATNHTHEVLRTSDQRLLSDLHESASPYRLLDYDGTTYSDSSIAATGNTDALTGNRISTRACGVRFRSLGGGPFTLAGDTNSSTRNLIINFAAAGPSTFVPRVGDKIVIPLIAREFDISDIPTPPTTNAPTGTVTVSDTTGIGFSIDATSSGNQTTVYFYREVAYTVYNNELRYHRHFSGASKASYVVIRRNVTSPKPFSLLYPAGSSSANDMFLRVSLEAYDGDYTARSFTNGTATLQAIIPPRTVPTPVSSTNYQ